VLSCDLIQVQLDLPALVRAVNEVESRDGD